MSTNIHAVIMPKLGLTMEFGSVATWHIELGAPVKEGDEIADIETEKATMAYEAPASGILRRVLSKPETELPVGALIGVIADTEVTDADIDSFIQGYEIPIFEADA